MDKRKLARTIRKTANKQLKRELKEQDFYDGYIEVIEISKMIEVGKINDALRAIDKLRHNNYYYDFYVSDWIPNSVLRTIGADTY